MKNKKRKRGNSFKNKKKTAHKKSQKAPHNHEKKQPPFFPEKRKNVHRFVLKLQKRNNL